MAITSMTQNPRTPLYRWLYKYLQTHPCIDCREANTIMLEFDHIRGKKKFSMAQAVRNHYSIQAVKQEIKKCVVRCANCHRLVTYLRNGCSHRGKPFDKQNSPATVKHMSQEYIKGFDSDPGRGVRGFAEKTSSTNAPASDAVGRTAISLPGEGPKIESEENLMRGLTRGGAEQSINRIDSSSDTIKLTKKGSGPDLSAEAKRINPPGTSR
jgi:hypothetical protein